MTYKLQRLDEIKTVVNDVTKIVNSAKIKTCVNQPLLKTDLIVNKLPEELK